MTMPRLAAAAQRREAYYEDMFGSLPFNLCAWSIGDEQDYTPTSQTSLIMSNGAALADEDSPTGFSCALNLSTPTANRYKVGDDARITSHPSIKDGNYRIMSADANGNNVTIACPENAAAASFQGFVTPVVEEITTILPAGTMFPSGITKDGSNGVHISPGDGLAFHKRRDATLTDELEDVNGVLPALGLLYVGLVFRMRVTQDDNTHRGMFSLWAGNGQKRCTMGLGQQNLGGNSDSRVTIVGGLGSGTFYDAWETDLAGGSTHLLEWVADGGTVTSRLDGVAQDTRSATPAGDISNWATTGIRSVVGAASNLGGYPHSSGFAGDDVFVRGIYVSTTNLIGSSTKKEVLEARHPGLSIN